MTKASRIGLSVAGGLVVLGVAGFAGLHAWLSARLSKEALVEQMEAAWNCRAQIDEAKLVLLSSPARLDVAGCKIAKRDAETEKALSKRTPLDPGNVEVSIDHAVLEVKLQDLIARRLNVQQLSLADIAVREEIDKEGRSSLGELFKKPPKTPADQAAPAVVDAGKPTVSVTANIPEAKAQDAATKLAAPSSPVMAQDSDVSQQPEGETFTAAELGFEIRVDRASLERAWLHMVNRKNTTTTDIKELRFAISEIDVNPDDLANHNRCNLAIGGRITVGDRIKLPDGQWRDVSLIDLVMDGAGAMRPFDPASGHWNAATSLDLKLRKDSVVAGYMKLGETGSKDLKKLEDYGIDLGDVTVGGPLLVDADIRVMFENNRITFRDDARFAMPEYELEIRKDSWLNNFEDEHDIQFRLICGPALRDKVAAAAEKSGLDKQQVEALIKMLSDEKGRLFFDFQSTGKLSKPNPKPDMKRLLNRVIEGLGESLLKGLIK